ncbi:MAG: hypothetical protein B7X54_09540 [Idiomarina sp. 34-48-12]|nr:MAG: hypothetical protein B7X54_09540 [Idiomarina sp. 34-48-12]
MQRYIILAFTLLLLAGVSACQPQSEVAPQAVKPSGYAVHGVNIAGQWLDRATIDARLADIAKAYAASADTQQ